MNLQDLVQSIHKTKTRAVAITTGGGSEFFGLLLDQGGGSNTLVSGLLPWSENELAELLGYRPAKFASLDIARNLAVVAYRRALKEKTIQTSDETRYIGVACTSILQRTPTEREGRIHKIYAALHTATQTVSVEVEISHFHSLNCFGVPATAFSARKLEEEINAYLLLFLTALGCGLVVGAWKLTEDLGEMEGTHIKSTWTASDLKHPQMLDFQNNPLTTLAFSCGEAGVKPIAVADKPKLVFPGSFNPPHSGHLELAEASCKRLGVPCVLELSLRNVEKPDLDWIEVQRRLEEIGKAHPEPIEVHITTAPTFRDKVHAFPGCTFVVGQDTAARIIQPEYTALDGFQAALDTFGNRFLVYGRMINGDYRTGSSGFPEWFTQRADWDHFRREYASVSSSEIRRMREKFIGGCMGDD